MGAGSIMDKLEAQEIIPAYAACSIVNGCDLCPFYEQEKSRLGLRGKCQEKTTPDRIRKALTTLRGKTE